MHKNMDLKTIDILKIETTGLVGLFAGGAIFANIVDIPALRKVTDDAAVGRYWKEFFLRGSKWQEGLAILPMVTSGVVYFMDESDRRYLWLVGAGLLATMFPWTVLLIKPDSDKLLEDDFVRKRGGDWLRSKIETWNKRHMYRSLIGLSVFGIFLYALES